MGRKWTDAEFGKRVRAERELRGWSQAEMAKMLDANGIQPMHPTTIAKIEAGDRSVRINEAFGIADLFRLPIEVLVGRAPDRQSDQKYAVRALVTGADRSARQVRDAAGTLLKGLHDMAKFDFEGRASLEADGKRAVRALDEAYAALTAIAEYMPPAPEAEESE